jgi:hypothetical protein
MSDKMTPSWAAETSRRDFLKASTAALAGVTLAGAPETDYRTYAAETAFRAAELRVGAAAAELQAEDSMVIAGGIHPRHVKGQEGQLRAVAVVLEKPLAARLAIVACDVLMLTRDQLDPVAGEIERTCGIPASNVLINCTHTHHAPSTCRVHGYDRDEVFCKRVERAIVKAVSDANANLADATFHFKLGQEKTVGQNSRLLMSDGSIHWIGSRDDAVRPTGPFDPDLPVLALRDPAGTWKALIFNHSTHTIGAVKGNLRSPAFYGLAAQELEAELGGTVCFLEGASGSTHRMDVGPAEATGRITQAVLGTLAQAEPQDVQRLASIKRPFEFKVRTFDEAAEEKAVSDYCRKRAGVGAESIIAVFREMRKQLAPHQGKKRTTWLQTMLIGDVAIVGVPAEFFTQLGVDIKRRSPLKHTYVAELANDWIGYVGDREAYKLGGYQLWMGLHSYCEPGTGERMVDQAVAMLRELGGA